MTRYRNAGFTLIELMIVVAIIGVLALIVYPNYKDSVRRARFGAAKEGTMRIASALERAAAQANAYPASIDSLKPAEYAGDFDFVMTPSNSNRAFVLKTTEKVQRFRILVLMNAKGTKCGCSGDSCDPATDLGATDAVCPAGTGAF